MWVEFAVFSLVSGYLSRRVLVMPTPSQMGVKFTDVSYTKSQTPSTNYTPTILYVLVYIFVRSI